ncbi:hypothetical protein DPEC_G00124240 [Dallia pectoralis]|uniref:Uncharacterized protein n=1 Tax=Dallia pectoralis TaxID=75939 RepID=A0ACC2GRF8_DALPE|nr:hypothetical protein DPEC_G00124240 [Dallia pectoralis]
MASAEIPLVLGAYADSPSVIGCSLHNTIPKSVISLGLFCWETNQILGLGEQKQKSKYLTDPSRPHLSSITGGAGDIVTMATEGMSREEAEEYQKQLVEEKIERDSEFLVKKAERATLRTCLRDKYRLPKSEQDANLMELAGDDIDVPEELLQMVDEDAKEEEEKDSILGQIQNLQNMDMNQIKEKASATMSEIKSKAEEKCSVM